MPTYKDALSYDELGMVVIPIRPGEKRPAVKKLSRWAQDPPDRRTMRRWWQDEARGMAVMLGDVSDGHAVRDFDVREAYLDWAAAHPALARKLPTARTARGWHVHFRADVADVRDLSPSTSTIIHCGDGELKAGGYVLLPPSTHPSGASYVWDISPFDVGIPYVSDLVRAGLTLPARSSIASDSEAQTDGQTSLRFTQEDTRGSRVLPVDSLAPIETTSTEPSMIQTTEPPVESIEAAIEITLPTGPGQRHRRLFRLARILKSLPDYAHVEADEVKPVVRIWWEKARPAISTKDWLVTWTEFVDGWGRVRVPWGASMTPVVEAARQEGCPPEVVEDCYGQPSGIAAAICRELARRENGVFFLDCRTLGRCIGVSHTTANKILRGLEHVGLTNCLIKGTRGKASEYRYLGSLD